MQDYLKHYSLKLTALSPIHIGDGTQIGKKEYFHDRSNKQVIIPDTARMFADLCKLHRDSSFEDLMLRDKNGDLVSWFREQRLDASYIKRWTSYVLEAGDAFIETSSRGRTSRPRDIMVFVKDAYGQPYIPGSSLKGMIKSALLAYEVQRNIGQYSKALADLRNAALNSFDNKSRKRFLNKETDALEAAVFNTLDRDKRTSNAVNSVMSGLIVSDSKAISTSKLALCQKIDLKTDGRRTALPILREALIPDTEVFFDITIDTKIFPYTIEDIMQALNIFNDSCYEYFYKHFGRGSVDKDVVWVGGGTGFLSKTVLYQIYGRDGLKLADAAFKNTIGKNYRVHRHDTDIRNGISPHVCKCTYYHGRLYDMGMGRLELIN